MDRLNSSYYSLAELPDILSHYFSIDITLKELIKCAEKVALITSFKAKGDSNALMFGNKKVAIQSIPSHVKYKESILNKGYLGTLKLEDEYRMISFKLGGQNNCNLKDVDEIKREYSSNSKEVYISLSDANFDYTDFFVIPRTCYLNNSFNQSELKLSVKDFKNYPVESSERNDIAISLWFEKCDENNISILLPYSDIYVTHSHLYDFCRSYKKTVNKIKEKEEYEKIYLDKIKKLEEQLKEALITKSQSSCENNNGIKDLTTYFDQSKKEYPNYFLETVINIYENVWVNYFINRTEKSAPKPKSEMIIEKIKMIASDKNWSKKEIEMLEKVACPILREGKKIKIEQNKHNKTNKN